MTYEEKMIQIRMILHEEFGDDTSGQSDKEVFDTVLHYNNQGQEMFRIILDMMKEDKDQFNKFFES